MQSLVAIGIDVHKDKFALVAVLLVLGAQDQILGEVEVGSDYKEILAFIESIKKKSRVKSCSDPVHKKCSYSANT